MLGYMLDLRGTDFESNESGLMANKKVLAASMPLSISANQFWLTLISARLSPRKEAVSEL